MILLTNSSTINYAIFLFNRLLLIWKQELNTTYSKYPCASFLWATFLMRLFPCSSFLVRNFPCGTFLVRFFPRPLIKMLQTSQRYLISTGFWLSGVWMGVNLWFGLYKLTAIYLSFLVCRQDARHFSNTVEWNVEIHLSSSLLTSLGRINGQNGLHMTRLKDILD